MGLLDSFGALVSSVIAFVLMIVLAIISFYFVVFIVDVGAGLAGLSTSGDFVVLSAAVLVSGAIVAGASPLTAVAGEAEERTRE